MHWFISLENAYPCVPLHKVHSDRIEQVAQSIIQASQLSSTVLSKYLVGHKQSGVDLENPYPLSPIHYEQNVELVEHSVH